MIEVEFKNEVGRTHRLFQKVATLVGVVLAIVGFIIQNPSVWVIGLVILMHGLIALVFILVDSRRPRPMDTTASHGDDPSPTSGGSR